MAYIYKIENTINGKVYIGKTEDSYQKRFQQHCNDATKACNKNRPLYSAIRKYGKENFTISLIEEVNSLKEDLNEREKYWIEFYGSFKNGYNATLGGDGKAYIDYNEVIKLYRLVKNQAEVARIMKISSDTVNRVLNNYAPKEKLSHAEAVGKRLSKQVLKIDKDTNEIIELYSSVQEAERKNNIKNHIGSVCSGKRKTAGGYIWKYID